VHPADVLFFLNPIRRWLELGHSVFVASRHKDVTTELLDAFSIAHTPLSAAGGSLPGLALELMRRDLALLAYARRLRPDVMCGFGGVAISHVGKVIGVPALSFYDTERAPVQNRLSLPYISHLYVPESYDGPIAKNRTTRFPGTKDASYLHPDNFQADPAVAVAAGLATDRPNYFLRLVSWRANHDVGHAGWSESILIAFVSWLAARGKVHLSSEAGVPAAFAQHRYTGPVHEVHHLLAHCDVYIGESATMAGEAVMLGVPAIYAAADRRCYTDELAAKGMLWLIKNVEESTLCDTVEIIEAQDSEQWERRVNDYRTGCINLADYIVEAVLGHCARR
jgi:predicted glycosyltransferase